MAAGKGVIVGL